MSLFNYVMQTPQNTNPEVLSSEISKAIEESKVQADCAQNAQNAKGYIKIPHIAQRNIRVCGR